MGRLVQTEEHDSAPTRRNIGWGCCNPSPQLLDWLVHVHPWGLQWQGQVPAGAASSPRNASKGMCPAAVALERRSERKQMRETCSNWTPRAQGLLCEQRQRDLAPAAEPQTLTNPTPAWSYGLRADKLRRVSVERTSADQGRAAKADLIARLPGSGGGGGWAAAFLEALLDTVFSFDERPTRGLCEWMRCGDCVHFAKNR